MAQSPADRSPPLETPDDAWSEAVRRAVPVAAGRFSRNSLI
jgi:hypothetical protein